MRWIALPVVALLTGCGAGSSYVHSETTLGRVVVYRNGVAYFERYAQLDEDSLKLSVPADKVDDFLKSLTVVDAKTGKPAPVAYPTDAPREGGGLIDMKISLPGPRPHQVRLSYVTSAPSWKPSYRVVLGKGSKVDFQAWAIVDNTSGEDWQNVKLGVGSSSAMSFQFDLRSLRMVERETLRSNDLFALAPPSGGSIYNERAPDGQRKVAELDDSAIKEAREVVVVAHAPTVDVGSTTGGANLNTDFTSRVAITNPGARGGARRSYESVAEAVPGATADTYGKSISGSTSPSPASAGGYGSPNAPSPAPPRPSAGRTITSPPPAAPPPPAPPPDPIVALTQRINTPGNRNLFTIEGRADPNDSDKNGAALARAEKVREQLLRRGVDPNRVVAVARVDTNDAKGGVRVLESAQPVGGANPSGASKSGAMPPAADPIGTSHFESGVAMSVPRGTSAMVSIMREQAEGEVVYLYDPESARGNSTFAFKAVRIKNPTDSALESGPVSVFGDGRFIGEGLSEPIPARTTAFVPFALDRQVVVEPKNEERDEIARVLTVQRGVFSTEMQHTRRAAWTLYNRLGERVTVYVRHSVPQGHTLSAAALALSPEKIGGAYLFRVELKGGEKKELAVESAAPEFKTVDVRTAGGMDIVRVFMLKTALTGALKAQMNELLKLHQEMGNIEQRILTAREQMQEYRSRMDELHAQIVTLRAVKTAGPLMHDLERKLQDVGDKLSKATIEVVALQEKLMVSRVHLQDGVADLSLEKRDEKREEKAKK